MTEKKICIIGAGGFGREVLFCLIDILSIAKLKAKSKIVFMVDDKNYEEPEVMGIPVIKFSTFMVEKYRVVVAIGDPYKRKMIIEKLPKKTEFMTVIHPTAVISECVRIGEGSIITAGTILTCEIDIGKHAHLNLHTTIGHNCIIGNYFTTAPAVNISGSCKFGNCVYLGTNASIKQGITVCDNVTIGMGGVVVKHINSEGIYVGNPVKKIEKKC